MYFSRTFVTPFGLLLIMTIIQPLLYILYFHILLTRYKDYDMQNAVLNSSSALLCRWQITIVSTFSDNIINAVSCPRYVLERRLCIYLGHSEFSAASGKSCTLLVHMTLK